MEVVFPVLGNPQGCAIGRQEGVGAIQATESCREKDRPNWGIVEAKSGWSGDAFQPLPRIPKRAPTNNQQLAPKRNNLRMASLWPRPTRSQNQEPPRPQSHTKEFA